MKPWRWLGRVAYRLAWPALLVYLRRGSRTRVLVLAENHVLLVQGWLSNGQWGLPGGGLHREEEAALGAVREVAEETGIQLRPEQLQRLGDEWRSKDGLRFHCHFFVVRPGTRDTLRKQRGEIVGAEWVSLNYLSQIPHAQEVDYALELLAAAR